jgi:hypothetical protein
MGQNRFCLEAGGWGKVAQTMCTHVSKCKTDKIKGEKKKRIQISNGGVCRGTTKTLSTVIRFPIPKLL